MKKKLIKFSLVFLLLVVFVFAIFNFISVFKTWVQERARTNVIEEYLQEHRSNLLESEVSDDVFRADSVVKILLLGLDNRVGQVQGHCDVIQFIKFDKNKGTVLITAVPRGTYAPLPVEGNYLATDYYVSNACGVVGLEYGIEQIEKILGEKADYVVTVGFSEVLGILRSLQLPTTETLQWLRVRQGYAIGEPQRARDHSTFLKYLLTNFVPKENTVKDKLMQYVVYKTVQTDLSFSEAQSIVKFLADLDLVNNPERIILAMKPAYEVQDIPYSPEILSKYLKSMENAIKASFAPGEYQGVTKAKAQESLLAIIEEKKHEAEFIDWAMTNDLWLQVEDQGTRLSLQFDFLTRYLAQLSDNAVKQELILDYILEMEYLGEAEWAEKGRGVMDGNWELGERKQELGMRN